MEKCDVAIVGAGPYGLSAAAHLATVKGLELKLFGEPMSFWEQCMPEDMLLRSPWDGSHIADPENRLTLDAYRNLNGNRHLSEPLPLKDFIRYGHWFREQAKLCESSPLLTDISSSLKAASRSLHVELLWRQAYSSLLVARKCSIAFRHHT
jgi:hypothetical protein